MRNDIRLVYAAVALFLCATIHAEDHSLLKAKVELLVDQTKEYYTESFNRNSETYGAPYQYYFGLMYATGTNLMARGESQKNTVRLQKYCGLIEKDYEAYTKVDAAMEKAAATGGDRILVGRHVVRNGSRHRAKRLINAEKLRDKELADAISRWEKFVIQLKKDPIGK